MMSLGLIGLTRQYYFDAKVSDAGAVPSVASRMSDRRWAQGLCPATSSEVIRRQRLWWRRSQATPAAAPSTASPVARQSWVLVQRGHWKTCGRTSLAALIKA
jgi:hypothetical protein